MMTFSIDHIDVSFKRRDEVTRPLFRDLSLSIPAGECVGILGQEGSGKTSLLNILGGLVAPDSGISTRRSVTIEKPDASPECPRIAFTFQFPDEQFLRQTVSQEFQDLLALRGIDASEAAIRMGQSLRAMGLHPPAFADRSPFTLSLGESRRMAVALAVAMEPEALLMDEPTSGLDAGGIDCVVKAIRQQTARGTTVVVATHDVDFVAEVAGRILILDGGGIAADGPAARVLAGAALLRKHGYTITGGDAAPGIVQPG